MCLFSVQLSSPSTLPNLLAYKLTLAVNYDLPAAIKLSFPATTQHVRPSGLLCHWPNGLELTARQALRPIAID